MTRHRVISTVRVVASAALLVFLVSKVPSDALPEWHWGTGAWLVGAVLVTIGAIVISAVRWQQVLHALDTPQPLGPLTKHYFAGQFISNVLPTTIGGDVVRINRLHNQQKVDTADSFASVVIERLTGWLVLPLMSLAGFMLNSGLRTLGRATALGMGLACVVLIGLVVVLWLGAHEKGGGRYAEHEDWRRFLGAVHLGLDQLRRHPRDAWSVVLVAFAYQGALVLAGFMAAHSLDIPELGLTAAMAFIPAILTLQVMPLTISGLGVREGALVLFLTPLGVPTEKAIALGLLLYFLNLVASLVGAPAFAFGGSHELDPDDVLADA